MAEQHRPKLKEMFAGKKFFNKIDIFLNEFEYQLTEEQQYVVLVNKNTKNVLELARKVFNDMTIIESDEQFKNVRRFLNKLLRKYIHAPEFTDDELESIANLGTQMTPSDIARHIRPDSPNLNGVEAPYIARLLKAMNVEYIGPKNDVDNIIYDEYEPPTDDRKILAKINEADPLAKYHPAKLDSFKRECIAALKRNMNSPRFKALANSIKNKKHRELYEIEFIRTTYMHPDLTADEANSYSSLAHEYVNHLELKEQISMLNDRLTECALESEDGRKFSMTFAETLSEKQKESNASLERIARLIKSLAGDRAKRKETQSKSVASLASLIESLQDEKERNRLIRVAEARELVIEKEVERLDDFDSVFVEIFGQEKNKLIQR